MATYILHYCNWNKYFSFSDEMELQHYFSKWNSLDIHCKQSSIGLS